LPAGPVNHFSPPPRVTPAGKPEARAEGIRVVPPEANRIPLGSRRGLQGHEPRSRRISSSIRRLPLPGSPKRELREYASFHRKPTAFPRLAPRASRARTTKPTCCFFDPSAPLAGKPEARAEGIRVVPPEAQPHSLGSRLGLQGHGVPRSRQLHHAGFRRSETAAPERAAPARSRPGPWANGRRNRPRRVAFFRADS
jgi:hypothetical protein